MTARDPLRDVWWEKHRPTHLDQLALREEYRRELEQYLESGTIPHLFLAGPAGTGKTTLAELLVDHIGGTSLVLNASDERGIDTIRGTIKEFARTSAGPGSLVGEGLKIVVLDEADALTRDAQTALRRIIERWASTTRFILTANYPEEILDPIKSRLRTMNLGEVPEEEKARVLRRILEAEAVDAEEGAVEELARTHADLRTMIDAAQRSVVRHDRVVATSAKGEEVGQRIRETVRAVQRLNERDPGGVSYPDLRKELGVSKTTAWERGHEAQAAGYLRDRAADEEGTPARLVVTERWRG